MGQPALIFLHGALGCKGQWERFLAPFTPYYDIHNIDFPGHGDSPLIPGNGDLSSLTGFLKNYIQENGLDSCDIIGYSMGGYAALQLVADNSVPVNSLITLATKLKWDREIAEEECRKLTEDNLQPIMEQLHTMHGFHMSGLLEHTRSILRSIGLRPIGKEQFAQSATPVTMLRGNRDRMVSDEEVTTFTEGIPSFDYISLENQPHLLEKMDAALVSTICLQILDPLRQGKRA